MTEVNYQQHQTLFRQMLDAQAEVLAHKKETLRLAHDVNALGPAPEHVPDTHTFYDWRDRNTLCRSWLEAAVIKGLVLQALYEDAYATYHAAYNPAYVIPFGQT